MPEDNREDSPQPVDSLEQQQQPAEQSEPPTQSEQELEPATSETTGSIRTFFIAVAGWIVPGLGHLFQGRIGRALVAFLAVGAMAFIGMRMRGNVFPPHGDDIFGVLGFLADAGSGIFYIFAHTIQTAGPDVS